MFRTNDFQYSDPPLLSNIPYQDSGMPGSNSNPIMGRPEQGDGFSITTQDVVDTTLDFVPIAGGVKDIYRGYQSGDGWQVAMGVGFIILDVATLGGSSIVKGVVKTGAKVGSRAIAKNAAKGGAKGGLNLFKWGKKTTTTSKGWKEGDYMLNLPDRGTPKLNWKQNSGYLRKEMRKGNPIYDSY